MSFRVRMVWRGLWYISKNDKIIDSALTKKLAMQRLKCLRSKLKAPS